MRARLNDLGQGACEIAINDDAGKLVAVITHPVPRCDWFLHRSGVHKAERFKTRKAALDAAGATFPAKRKLTRADRNLIEARSGRKACLEAARYLKARGEVITRDHIYLRNARSWHRQALAAVRAGA